jgi:hypothetical protein
VARWLAGTLLFGAFALGSYADAELLEWRPSVGGGYSNVLEAHGAINAALRVQISPYLLVQGEYLALPAEGHTDHGPTLFVGLSGGSRTSLRPFVGVGGGPVNGYQDDDGIFYVATGLSHPITPSGGAFIQGEVRYGLLGESTYWQFSVSVGLSR